MGTVDSGNETLFSDDSSCDLLDTSPTSPCSPTGQHDREGDIKSSTNGIAPPKIQSCSGVLGKVGNSITI